MTTQSRDEAKAEAYARSITGQYSSKADWNIADYYLAGLREARTESQAEIDRLKRIIAKELTENDELGSEFTYVVALKAEISKLRELLERAKELMRIDRIETPDSPYQWIEDYAALTKGEKE